MFSRFPRPSLRRCIHTKGTGTTSAVSQARLNRLGVAVAVGAATSYFAWRLTSDNRRIALDTNPSTSRSSSSFKTLQAETSPSSDASDSIPAQTSTSASPAKDDSQSKKEAEITGATIEDSDPEDGDAAAEGSSAGQSGGGGAYDPVTGEINWDCPCLGGMAHGPCGEDFKAAFSCFVYSEQEPKGIDCVEKFKAMQDCFRAHPEQYADQIMDDDDDDEQETVQATPGEEKGEEKDEEKGEGKGAHIAEGTPRKLPDSTSAPKDTSTDSIRRESFKDSTPTHS